MKSKFFWPKNYNYDKSLIKAVDFYYLVEEKGIYKSNVLKTLILEKFTDFISFYDYG